MMDFEFNFGRWLKIKGRNLKGRDLAIALLFLAFVLTLLVIAFGIIDLPKVQLLF